MIIRDATAEDHAKLSDLIAEMADYWWGGLPPTLDRVEDVVDAIVYGSGTCSALVAEADDGALIAVATYSLLQVAPSKGGTLFMKDLFVSSSARSAGLGTDMMSALAQKARALDCVRFDWTAETSNPRAIDLYHRLG
ncbi:MAG: GNAT family N-acetyltransferase, partial [Pseudomonadota bacterium]